jgi:hypothetical protein
VINIPALGRLAASVGFGLATTALETITLRLGYGNGQYNPESDTIERTGGQDVAVGVLPYQERSREQPTDVLTRNFLVQAADLPAGVRITQQDTLVDAAGNTWEILEANPDPSGATYILSARRR